MTAAVAVRERPILFSGEMVRAILDEKKTQTRRTRGLEQVNADPDGVEFDRWQDGYRDGRRRAVFIDADGEPGGIVCPYGQPGDRLWVRETWGVIYGRCRSSHCALNGCMSEAHCPGNETLTVYRADGVSHSSIARWSPSIHMPRRASRITLELTDVRVERVQDISEEDARAEGASYGRPPYQSSEREWFSLLWDSINAKRGYGWDANPFVWVLSFRRLES